MLPLWAPAEFCPLLLSGLSRKHWVQHKVPQTLHSPSPKHTDSFSMPRSCCQGVQEGWYWQFKTIFPTLCKVLTLPKQRCFLLWPPLPQTHTGTAWLVKTKFCDCSPYFLALMKVLFCVDSWSFWCSYKEADWWSLLLGHLALLESSKIYYRWNTITIYSIMISA